MQFPEELKFSKEHEWARVEDGKVWVGISDYAQDQLGDVVYVELPEIGQSVQQDESFVVVESVKSVSDVYAPVSGTVVQVNQNLEDEPELINDSPYEEGWMAVIEPAELGQVETLLDAAAYQAYIETL